MAEETKQRSCTRSRSERESNLRLGGATAEVARSQGVDLSSGGIECVARRRSESMEAETIRRGKSVRGDRGLQGRNGERRRRKSAVLSQPEGETNGGAAGRYVAFSSSSFEISVGTGDGDVKERIQKLKWK